MHLKAKFVLYITNLLFCAYAQGNEIDLTHQNGTYYPPVYRLSNLSDSAIQITGKVQWSYHVHGNSEPQATFEPWVSLQPKLPRWDWGFSHPLWGCLRIKNTGSNHASLLLDIGEHDFSYLYEIREGSMVQIASGGMMQNAAASSYPFNKSFLPFQLDTGESKTIFIKIFDMLPFVMHNVYLSSPAIEETRSAKIVQELLPLYLYFSVVCGLLFFMSGIGLARYFIFSDRSFVYYGLYVGLNGLYFFMRMDSEPYIRGPIYYYCQWAAYYVIACLILSYAFYIQFGVYFLSLPKTSPTRFHLFKRLFLASLILFFIAILVFPLVNNRTVQFAVTYGALVVMMLIGVIGVITVWTIHSPLARIMIFGTLFYYIGSVLGFLESINLITVPVKSVILHNPLFPTSLGCLIEAIAFFAGLGYRQKLLQAEKSALEAQYTRQIETNLNILQAAQQEKERIARDLHDDVGSTLSSISILSESFLWNVKTDLDKSRFGDLGNKARTALENISDIVWSLNPENDSVEHVLTRMSAFGAEMLENVGAELSFQVSEDIGATNFPIENRKDFYLIFKEAIHNCAKYAQAKRVEVQLKTENHKLVMTIKDDGIGFDPQQTNTSGLGGNGLKNMQRRAAAIGGDLSIKSAAGGGTVLQVAVPFVP